MIYMQEVVERFSALFITIVFIFIVGMLLTLPQLRRERIAERIRALQELVPTVNKVGLSLNLELHFVTFVISSQRFSTCCFSLQTDRAAMIDEIVDYVKFLRLQVKVV